MNISGNIENLTQTQIQTQTQNQTQNKIAPTQPATSLSQARGNAPVVNDDNLADKAQLSNAANQVAQSPSDADVRLDKVASIQNSLKAGTYSVPASAVAQKVIGSLLQLDQ